LRTLSSMHFIDLRCSVLQFVSLLFAQRRTHSSLVYVHAALSLPWHDKQHVSLCSSCSAVLIAHSCMCGAVSAMVWQTAGKSLLFAQRCIHSSLVHVHAALSLAWHGMAWYGMANRR
jgi:hypothetical protein